MAAIPRQPWVPGSSEAAACCLPGLLVPDIPLEETPLIRQACAAAGLELVLLTTPTTPLERMTASAKATQGFLYLVSLTGVTGMKDVVEGRVQDLVRTVHSVTDKPVSLHACMHAHAPFDGDSWLFSFWGNGLMVNL